MYALRLTPYASFLTLLLICFFTNKSFSQEENVLFEVISVPVTSDSLNHALIRYETMSRNDAYDFVVPINLNDVKQKLKKGGAEVKLPDGSALNFSTKTVKSFSSGEFEWYGEVIDQPASYFTLQSKDGAIFGSIVCPSGFFKIRQLESGFHVLIKMKSSHGKAYNCVSHQKIGVNGKRSLPQKSNCGPIRTIRVLTLYSAGANANGTVVQDAADEIQRLNQATSNSGIASVRFEAAGVRLYPGFVKRNTLSARDDINDDYDDLRNDLNDPNTTIGGYRDDYNADLVVLYVADNYIDPGTNIRGRAGNTPIQAANAYAIVSINSDLPSTYLHELSHNLGCQHSGVQVVDNLVAIDANAHTFTGASGGQFKTIVEAGGIQGMSILHFSNPSINYDGVPTGIPGNTFNSRNNARQIDEETACVVSCYQLGGDPMSVYISGFTSISEGQSSTWCANVYDCYGTTTFDWAYSTNGFSYTSVSGSSCLNFTAPINVSQFWLRVTATCSDGQVKEDIHRVRVLPDSGGGGPIKRTEYDGVVLLDDQTVLNNIEVFPNPSASGFNVDLSKVELSGHSQLDVINELGVVEISTILDSRKSEQFLRIDTSQLEKGTYALRIINSKGRILGTKKVIVL